LVNLTVELDEECDLKLKAPSCYDHLPLICSG